MDVALSKKGGISKKKKILLAVSTTLFVVFGISGAYLLWRVKQPETVAPEDSMAAPDSRDGGFTHFPCDGVVVDLPHIELKGYKVGQFVCGEGCMASESLAKTCPPTRTFTINEDNIFLEGIYEIKGLVGRGHKEQVQEYEDFQISINNSSYDKPKDAKGGSNEEYYETPQELGQYFIKEGLNTVVMSHMHKCPPKTDPNSVHLYKLCLKELNICEKGKWRKDPTGTHKYGTLKNPIVVETVDKDGLGEVIHLILNGNNLTQCVGDSAGDGGVNCYSIEGNNIAITLNSEEQNIISGEYRLDVKWEDGEGIGGSNCELSSEFNISEEPLPSDCGTNTGLVFEATETDWPEGGTFCSVGDPNPVNPIFPALGMTTEWECEGTSGSVGCSASRLKPVSPPPVVVEDPEPPPPSPVVVEEPTETPQAPVVAQRTPETGILDDIGRPVLMGSSLLVLGVTWSWIGRGMLTSITFLDRLYKKTVIGVKDVKGDNRKKKFEKKVGKRI